MTSPPIASMRGLPISERIRSAQAIGVAVEDRSTTTPARVRRRRHPAADHDACGRSGPRRRSPRFAPAASPARDRAPHRWPGSARSRLHPAGVVAMALIVVSRFIVRLRLGAPAWSPRPAQAGRGPVVGPPPGDAAGQAHPDRSEEDHVDDQVAQGEPGDISRARDRRVIDEAEDEVHQTWWMTLRPRRIGANGRYRPTSRSDKPDQSATWPDWQKRGHRAA